MDRVVLKKIEENFVFESPPVLVCGLPGIGNVARLAVDYIIEKMKMTKTYDIFSTHLPAQVFVNPNGSALLPRNSVFAKNITKSKSMLIFTGDFQGSTSEGQYEIAETILNMAKENGVKTVYTLGGYGIGKLVETPRVLGAVTDIKMKKKLESAGVIFSENEPGGGIIGSAGVIMGLAGEFYGMNAACIMGETSGYFTDPKAALAIIKTLSKLIGFRINLREMEERSRNIEQLTEKMQGEMQERSQKDDLGYFV
jgi:hypothetical protein